MFIHGITMACHPPPLYGQEDPAIIKRRNYLKKLSVQARNLLLTGDP
jgi:hypothetical protein